MTGYAKLFSSIIGSTIWAEDSDTRVVWITLLALAEFDGKVEASVPGLARLASVSREACEAALNKFESPDPDSRTPEHEGRRIEKVRGGWRILNYVAYQQKMDKEERNERYADRKRQKRAALKSRVINDVAKCPRVSASVRDVAHTDTDSYSDNKDTTTLFVLLPLNDGSEYEITHTAVAEFQKLYPAVDAEQEFRSMRAWLLTNPENRKTASGVMRFVNRWLSTQQNKPRGSRNVKYESAADKRLRDIQRTNREAAHLLGIDIHGDDDAPADVGAGKGLLGEGTE